MRQQCLVELFHKLENNFNPTFQLHFGNLYLISIAVSLYTTPVQRCSQNILRIVNCNIETQASAVNFSMEVEINCSCMQTTRVQLNFC